MDAVARRDDLRVAAVVDILPDAARAAVRERGWDVPCTDTVAEALRMVDAGMLLNVTVPEAHVDVSSAALRAGLPVLSEKPVAPTLAGALHLASISAETGTLLATSQSRRHGRGIRALRTALYTLGGAEQLDARFRQNPRFGGFRDRMASPLLVDMAIHTFDQARFVLGSEPVSVWCEEYAPSWSWYQGAAAAHAVFRFNDGARFAYSGSWCADGLTTSWNGHWRGDAAGGAAEWDGEQHVVTQSGDAGPVVQPLDDDAEGLDAALAEFVGALDGGAPPSGEISANVWSLAMFEAAVASSTTGAPVSLAAVFAAARAEAGTHR